MSVIKTNYPDLKFAEDSYGNILVDGTAYDGGIGYLNKPGLSIRDVADAGFTVATFTPAAKAGQAAKTTMGRMGTVGSAAGVTEAGVDIAGQMAGGTEDVSVANIDPANVALAFGGGGLFEGIGVVLAKTLAPAYRQTANVTDDMRNSFKEAATAVGMKPEDVTDDIIRSYMDDAVKTTGAGQGGEFGVRLTKGQESGEPGQLMLEDRLRSGPAGKARERMEGFAEKQDRDIMAARERIQGGMREGGDVPIARPVEAGERIIEGVREKAKAAQKATDTAYGEVGQASLSPEGQRGMLTRLGRIAKADQFETHVELAPATNQALSAIGAFKKLSKSGKLKDAPMRRLESFRKRMNNWVGAAANPTDKRQVMKLKAEFDNYLDKAVDRALFSGDPDALTNLKKARGLHSDYMKRFTKQDIRTRTGDRIKDEAGSAMQHIVEGDPTPEEAINYLFGVSKIGGKKQAAVIAKRLKEILPSVDWQTVRQAAFLKLTDPGKNRVFSGARMMTNITDAMNNSPTLMNTLFDGSELAMFTRFGKEVSRAQPSVAKYGNVSRSGHKAAEYIADAWGKMMIGLGFAHGGPIGAAVAKGGVESAKEVGKFRAGVKASKAISQDRPLGRLNIGQYGVLAAESDD